MNEKWGCETKEMTIFDNWDDTCIKITNTILSPSCAFGTLWKCRGSDKA